MKNLIVSPVGDKSTHKTWLSNNQEFDLFLIYYGDNQDIFDDYKKDCSDNLVKAKGEKGRLINSFFKKEFEIKFDFSQYQNIWLPDDDIVMDSKMINDMFKIHSQFGLELSQPSLTGFVHHEIVKNHPGHILRYTNFVEIMCPLMSKACFKKLAPYYMENYTSHGLDYLWPKILGYPKNKIAIIDKVIANHSRPVSQNYDRFPIKPIQDLMNLKVKYNLEFIQQTYSKVKL
jgi:hypothetical protein